MKNLWVILPVKGFEKSKLRLAKLLTDSDRKALAKAMFIDVIRVLCSSIAVTNIIVVTSNAEVMKLALEYGVTVVEEPELCKGLNAAVTLGVNYAQAAGAEQVMIIHADLPLLKQEHITLLQEAHGECAVTVVPDKLKLGSNVMMLTMPTKMQFFYGENSFHLHQLFCQQHDITHQTFIINDLMLDIDEPEDVIELSTQLIDNDNSATQLCLLNFPSSLVLTKKSVM